MSAATGKVTEVAAAAAAEIGADAEVDRGSEESFPASDAPSWTAIVRTGTPVRRRPQRRTRS
jgi:hypothetical protein